MKVLKSGGTRGSLVLFSDDDQKTEAGPLECEWCESELEVTVDDVRLAEFRDENGDLVSWLYAECGHCHKPALIGDSDLPSGLPQALRIFCLNRQAS